MQRLLKLKKILRNGSLLTFAENFRNPKNSDSRFRALTPAEIEILEKNGNRSENWSLLRVEQNFTPHTIHRSVFIGAVRLPAFYGTLLLPGDVSFPTGIYDSLIHNCEIENALIYRVSMLSNVCVRRGAVLQNVGSLISSGKVKFLSALSIGNECGGRTLRVFPEINFEFLDLQVAQKNTAEFSDEFVRILEDYEKDAVLPFGIVESGAVLSNVGIVRNSWIGAHARIEGASKIRNTIVLSSLEETTGIYDSVILENAIVQEAATIYSSAQIKNSVACKKSKIGKNALVTSSVISSGAHIEEAEVTNSFVGPLVQMHHHSLLIAAVWPLGCGNIAYGANVGSNHSGRLPDQEIHPGVGMFFGLGTNIKFPANFKDAAYTMIASGVTTMPQRLEMPFSLILTGTPEKYGLPVGLNEIVPGWMFSKNQYALARNIYKYSVRAKNMVSPATYDLFSLVTARAVRYAYRKLAALSGKEVYSSADLFSLGSNYLRESVRQTALMTYKLYLEHFMLKTVLTAVETDSSLFPLSVKEILKIVPGEFFKEFFKEMRDSKEIKDNREWGENREWREFEMPMNVSDALKRYRQILKDWYDGIILGVERDKKRGQKIFDDYEIVHQQRDDAFLEYAKNMYEEEIRRINILGNV